MVKNVLVLMGSDSDLPVMIPALRVLKDFGVGYEVKVLSVHRAPDLALQTAQEARADGFGVIIAAAGLAAHLAGAVAAKTTLPVIGVPIESGPLRGVDALYAIVQMPPGVPVASVAIGGAKNAGLLAVQILSVADDRLADALEDYKKSLVEQVQGKAVKVKERLREEGL